MLLGFKMKSIRILLQLALGIGCTAVASPMQPTSSLKNTPENRAVNLVLFPTQFFFDDMQEVEGGADARWELHVDRTAFTLFVQSRRFKDDDDVDGVSVEGGSMSAENYEVDMEDEIGSSNMDLNGDRESTEEGPDSMNQRLTKSPSCDSLHCNEKLDFNMKDDVGEKWIAPTTVMTHQVSLEQHIIITEQQKDSSICSTSKTDEEITRLIENIWVLANAQSSREDLATLTFTLLITICGNQIRIPENGLTEMPPLDAQTWEKIIDNPLELKRWQNMWQNQVVQVKPNHRSQYDQMIPVEPILAYMNGIPGHGLTFTMPILPFAQSRPTLPNIIWSATINFIMLTCMNFGWHRRTFQLAVNMMNRLTSRLLTFDTPLLTIIAAVTTAIAAKYEEHFTKLSALLTILDIQHVNRHHLAAVERFVLKVLDWKIDSETPFDYLIPFYGVSVERSLIVIASFKLVDVFLTDPRSVSYSPKLIAAASYFVAARTGGSAEQHPNIIFSLFAITLSELSACIEDLSKAIVTRIPESILPPIQHRVNALVYYQPFYPNLRPSIDESIDYFRVNGDI